MGTYRLRCKGTEYELPEGDFVIGRTHGCRLALDDHRISRQHAVIRTQQPLLRIEDLGSRNGTFVNGRRIEGVHSLGHLDRIGIGSYEIVVLGTTAGRIEAPAPPSLQEVETRGARPALGPAFHVVADVARRALAAGRMEEAERVLAVHLQAMLAAAAEGARVPIENLERATELALQAAAERNQAHWITWIFRVHGAMGRVPSREAVERLYDIARNVPAMDPRSLHEYLKVLHATASELSPAQRFEVRRLESLAGLLGGARTW